MCVYPHLYPRTCKMHLPISHMYPCQNLLSGSFSLSLVSVLFVGSPFRVELVESCYLPWLEFLKLHMWNAGMKPVLFLPYFCVESWVFLFEKLDFWLRVVVAFLRFAPTSWSVLLSYLSRLEPLKWVWGYLQRCCFPELCASRWSIFAWLWVGFITQFQLEWKLFVRYTHFASSLCRFVYPSL